MSEKKIETWHFVRENRRLGYGCGLTVEPGYVYGEPTGEIVMCQRGMHASREAFDALQYAAGPILCRCLSWGDVEEGDDKLVSRYRQVLAMRDVSREMRLFACWCIRNTTVWGGHKMWDLLPEDRWRNAVEVAERFAEGRATAEELFDAKVNVRKGWLNTWSRDNIARAPTEAAIWTTVWSVSRAISWYGGYAKTNALHRERFNSMVLGMEWGE